MSLENVLTMTTGTPRVETQTARGIETLKRMIETHCGLNLSAQHDNYLVSRVEQRMKEVDVARLDEYLFLLFERGDDELHHLINLLTINETYFFRHREQFDLLVNAVRLKLAERPLQPVTIWCAACSSGAEPYSVAIALHDIVEQKGLQLNLMATDIDQTALAVARAGRYSRRGVTAEMDAEHLTRWFTPLPDGNFQLDPKIMKMVRFRRHNLKNDLYPTQVDIVFCRNVLIYFNESNKWEVIRRMHDALAKDGHLFLSPVESLVELRAYFDEETSPNGLKCYRKWSTDLRLGRPAPPSRILRQRLSLENQPMPVVTRRQDRIVCEGVIEGDARAEIFGQDLLFALGQFATDGERRFTLDLTGAPYICNRGLEVLIARLRDGIKNGARPRHILVRDERVKSSLVAAGILTLSQIRIGPEPIEEPSPGSRSISPKNAPLPEKPASRTPPRLHTAGPRRSEPGKDAGGSALARAGTREGARMGGRPRRTAEGGCPPPLANRATTPLVVGGIHSPAESARWIDRLYEFKRQTESSGQATTLTLDMRSADYVEQDFFPAFRHFLEQVGEEWKVLVLCPGFLKLWFLKYQIAESILKVTE